MCIRDSLETELISTPQLVGHEPVPTLVTTQCVALPVGPMSRSVILSSTGTSVVGPASVVTTVRPVTTTATWPSPTAMAGPSGSTTVVVLRSSATQASGHASWRGTVRLGASTARSVASPSGWVGSVVFVATTNRSATDWAAASVRDRNGTAVPVFDRVLAT